MRSRALPSSDPRTPPAPATRRRRTRSRARSDASPAGQSMPAPSDVQKMPNEVSITPTPNFTVFSGTRVSGSWTITAAIEHDDQRSRGADRRQADVALRATERHHDERDLEAFEEHALERDRERVPVVTGPRSGGLELRDLGRDRSPPRRAAPSDRWLAGSPCAATAARRAGAACRRRGATCRSAAARARGRARRR